MIDGTNTICDNDKIIVTDGRSYLSGNIRVTKEGIFEYEVPQSARVNSDLYDKVGDEFTYPLIGTARKILLEVEPKLFLEKGVKEFHFCNQSCLLSWLDKNSQKGGE